MESRYLEMKSNCLCLRMTLVNIFCADLASVERALKLVEEFGKIAGLPLRHPIQDQASDDQLNSTVLLARVSGRCFLL